MLSIGNKKYRNLQEQVGFNTEQIEKIFEILDGLNVQDNVVVVPDMSYILSQEELEIINREVAFIIYDNQLYIKKSQDASLAYFDIVFSISGSSTVISFNSKEIQVTLSNGALGIVVSTVSTYNQTQIDSLLSAKASITYVDTQLASGLASKANLAGANFTGSITAPSIIENMTNYSFDKQTLPVNFTLEYVYAGIVKNGNKLTAVIAMNITRTGTVPDATNVGRFNIPSAVSAKLFPVQIGGYNVLDMHKINASKDGINWTELLSRVYKGNNEFSVFLTATTLNALDINEKYYVRYEITFLLSDNLAQ